MHPHFAALVGVAGNDAYMHDLRLEIERTRVAYLGSAVTEIASLKAPLSGPHWG